MAIAVRRPPALPWANVGAIFRRDATVALSYPGNFALTWVGIVIQVVVAWYISRLIPPSPRFSSNGQTVPYFQYLVVNFAFVNFQTAALNSFAEAIRDGQ